MRLHNPTRQGGVILTAILAVSLLTATGIAVDQIFLDGEFTGAVLQFIIEGMQKQGSAILDFIFDTFNLPQADTAFMAPYIGGLSLFFPIDLFFVLLGAYITFYMFFVANRYIIKMVRGA